jgi:hypothetical protein
MSTRLLSLKASICLAHKRFIASEQAKLRENPQSILPEEVYTDLLKMKGGVVTGRL